MKITIDNIKESTFLRWAIVVISIITGNQLVDYAKSQLFGYPSVRNQVESNIMSRDVFVLKDTFDIHIKEFKNHTNDNYRHLLGHNGDSERTKLARRDQELENRLSAIEKFNDKVDKKLDIIIGKLK